MRILKLAIFIFSFCSVQAQVDPLLIGPLPFLIDEASGIECSHPDSCWTHNDNNDSERLYLISGSGAFLGQRTLQDASQIDYEDLALADDGRLFIGDFGNNANDRQDLSIYICSPSSSSGSLLAAEKIEFNLEDQTDFPPTNSNLNFDIEAMIYQDGFIYLFTRNRTIPQNGVSKMYRLDDSSGIQTATLQGDFIGNSSPTYSSITAADISPDGTRLALLTSGSLFLFHNLESWPLISGDPIYNFFSFTRNFEGLSFIDNCTAYLVSESVPGIDGELFSLNTCDIISDLPEPELSIGLVYMDGLLTYKSSSANLSFALFDILGRTQLMKALQGRIELPSNLAPGMYILQYSNGSSSSSFRFKI